LADLSMVIIVNAFNGSARGESWGVGSYSQIDSYGLKF